MQCRFAPLPAGAKYYELAFHDWTQKPICPAPKCVSSTKVFDPALSQVNDTFALQCMGFMFREALKFTPTQTPGRLLAWWNGLPGTPQRGWIPDTVVDFGLMRDGEGYDWVLEFQCVARFGRVLFAGVNFYSRQRDPGAAYIRELIAVAREHGLGVYLDYGMGLTLVDQQSCAEG